MSLEKNGKGTKKHIIKMRKPNFFVLGSGRCGTTSLYRMLKQHKDIFMSDIKEPNFFCSDFQVVKNPIDYFQLFSKCKNEKFIGEASHAYLSNPETPEVLHTLFPEAKFVLILRNPTNRVYSLYRYVRRRGFEKNKFEKAINIEEKRYKDENFKRDCPHYFWNYMYVRSSYYDVQLKRYLNLFDRDRFCFVNLFELSNNPIQWIEYICDFLEISSLFHPKRIEYRNKAKYEKIDLKIKKMLDEKFENTRIETEKIVGRKMFLDKL